MTSAIIVAAGKGVRMGAGIDKLFLEVAGRPVIAHAWARFDACAAIDELVLVVREERQPEFRALAQRFGLRKAFRFADGGPERQDSVWNGLQALDPASDLVAIHDGARPCTPLALIAATLAAAREEGAAVAAQRVTDTVKESADGRHISRHLDRTRLWAVQTPQCFRVEIIRRALEQVRAQGLSVTDDTAACELIGQPVRLVESAQPNPKVTIRDDLAYLETLLGQGQ
jgi:2-C-methyl-D-erythritol 4-phosphate cytidylyltransferase